MLDYNVHFDIQRTCNWTVDIPKEDKEEQKTKMVLKMANKSKLLAQIAKVVNYPAGTRKCGMIL